ncbi:MobF family relaxase [Granulicella paludicola]|uniref:MobF family relaxase n=1 Tax=Granulicella paludicola TaxID=474951 RepID=UPI0021E094B0|nr:MobF family relaxase [Granulicella paludicola]
MLTIRAMTGGQNYAARHLEHSDYYDRERTVQGEWHGRGAELLGLKGAVTHAQFEAIREGLHPDTQDFLRPRHSVDRLGTDGSVESKARSLYDLTLSAPKSVSVQALVGDDERLLEAHQKAVTVALQEAEQYAGVRVRVDEANHNRQTGNLVIAAYTHDSSRQLDPQLHTHAVAANLSFDGTEGRWKALQASGLYERRAYLTEVYRNELAREVRALGYDIESQRTARGEDNGFEIKGISKELRERYSQRSVQRDEAIREFVETQGRQPTDNEVAVLVRDTRPDKLHEISTSEVRERQLERISPQERQTLSSLREEAIEKAQSRTLGQGIASSSLQHAEEHLFERKTVAKDHELLTEALRHGRGLIELRGLKGSYELEVSNGSLLKSGGNVATQFSLERERTLVSAVNNGIGQYTRLGGQETFQAVDSLRDEQRKAVETILDSRDLAVNLRGAAGTGKTATLREIHRGLQDAGRKVVAVAPTRSAVEELQKVGLKESMTISRLLEDETAQQALRGRVLIVDEAGMVSGRQMQGILELAQRQDARILFSGDTRQIQSVESSDALRILERESKMTSVSLTGIQRQSNPEYRQAIQTFRESPDVGFAKLEELGAFREVPFLERAQTVAGLYRDMTSDMNKSVLVVAATHEEIGRVTHAIREELKQRGVLGREETLQRHIPLQWTEAQKKDIANYQEGQVLTFHRSSRGIEKHESLTVTSTNGYTIVTQNNHGEEKTVDLGQSRSFSVYESKDIDIANGDKLLLTANRRDDGFRATNGELVMVKEVGSGVVQLEDGRTLPADYREFTHGYAVTAHRSQGKTVDNVIISADAMKQELFYVSASRGRESIAIVTSNMEQLRESVGVSMARTSAMELANEITQAVPPIEKGVAAAVEAVVPEIEINLGEMLGLGF